MPSLLDLTHGAKVTDLRKVRIEELLGRDQVFIHSVKACELGVKRTHLIPYENDGAILTELFTHKGLGLMVVEEKLEFLRVANIEDISSILSLIEPLEKKGILKYRDRNSVENEIENFTVIEHDGIISGCVFEFPKSHPENN